MYTKNRYEADWRPYAFPPQKVGFASEDQLSERYTALRVEERSSAGGMPVQSDGVTALVNTESEHTIIFGGTGSKKTRSCIVPLACLLAQAGESMILADCKGELSNGQDFPQLPALLRKNGYRCIYINFRTLDGDAYNPLLEPYLLFRGGRRDEAEQMVVDFVELLAEMYHDIGTKVDPFWEQNAKAYLIGVLLLLFSVCPDQQKINLLSLSSYLTWEGSENIRHLAEAVSLQNHVLNPLRNVTSQSERTRTSTLATAASMMNCFLSNDRLMRMMGTSTFELDSLWKEPTAVFVILPDETSSYSRVAGILFRQLSTALIQAAYRQGGRLSRRFNFLCDEFCNYHIGEMQHCISADRSRNIRWYLVCQGYQQLKRSYPEAADTILANCANLYFLSSPDLQLVEYLSGRAGTVTVSRDGNPVPLISPMDLQGLRKTWEYTEAYFTSGNLHYFTRLPDISRYKALESDGSQPAPPRHSYPTPEAFTSEDLYQFIIRMYQHQRKDGQDMTMDDIMMPYFQ